MATTPPTEKQFHLYQLAGFSSALVTALGKAGQKGAQLKDLLSKCVTMRCIECGIVIAGEDLNVLVLSDPAAKIENPKLARLRQGYCARQGCASQYYLITCDPHPGLDWPGLLQVAEQGESTQPLEEPGSAIAASHSSASARRKSLIRAMVGAVIILVLLVCRHLMTGGSILGFHQESKFSVDPKSLSPDAPR